MLFNNITIQVISRREYNSHRGGNRGGEVPHSTHVLDSKAGDGDSVPSLCGAEGGGVVLGASLVRPEVVDLGLGNGSAGRRYLETVRKIFHLPLYCSRLPSRARIKEEAALADVG